MFLLLRFKSEAGFGSLYKMAFLYYLTIGYWSNSSKSLKEVNILFKTPQSLSFLSHQRKAKTFISKQSLCRSYSISLFCVFQYKNDSQINFFRVKHDNIVFFEISPSCNRIFLYANKWNFFTRMDTVNISFHFVIRIAAVEFAVIY